MSNVLKSVPKIREAVAPPLECWDEANLIKTCRSPKRITLLNLTAVYHTAWAWITGWNKFEPDGLQDPKASPLPQMHCRDKLCGSTSNAMGIWTELNICPRGAQDR